jgi:hypothetical protein
MGIKTIIIKVLLIHLIFNILLRTTTKMVNMQEKQEQI